jgi:hypothetical protein
MDELATRIEATAAAIDDIERRVVQDGTRYLLDGVEFAAVSGAMAAFRLRPDIAEAALKTPDVRRAAAPGWVELRPVRLDQFALDRATSWFAAAARYAAESEPGRLTH